MRHWIWVALGVAGATALVATVLPRGRAPSAAPIAHVTRLAGAAAPAQPELPPPPRSLDGTEVDGALGADGAGALQVTIELRRFFDYFLSVAGEEDEAVTRARIEAALSARLPPPAAEQARAILGRYLALRTATRGLAPAGDLEARLAQLRALRREVLGTAVAEAFFGDEEAHDEAALAHRPGPTPPEAVPVQVLAREQELRAAGAAPAEIRAVRATAFGEDGADRLEALDRAHDAWRARLEAYRAARAGLDGAAAERLLEESFTPEERLRVRVLAP